MAILTLLLGCNGGTSVFEDPELGEYDAEYAVPVFTATYSLGKVLNDLELGTDIAILPDGSIELKYSGEFAGRSAQELFDIITLALVPIEVIDTVQHVDYNIQGTYDIDFVHISSGNINMTFDSNFEEDLDVTVSIPQLMKDGDIFEYQFFVDYVGSTPVITTLVGEPLSGYTLTAQEDTLLTVNYDARLPNGDRVLLDEFVIILTDLEYDYAEGFLGTEEYRIAADTVEISFFNRWIDGSVYFDDPRVRLTALNSFGFPFDGKFIYMDVLTVEDGLLDVQSPFIDGGVEINFPNLDQVGETVETVFDFNKDNSNLREVLGAGPLALYYDIDMIQNPDSASQLRGFMTDSSDIRVRVEVDLPLVGVADHFLVRDTFDFNLEDLSERDIENIEFKFVSENELPLTVISQGYFADSDFQILDSLFETPNTIIQGAPINAEGISTDSVSETFFQTLTEDQVNRIKTAKQLILNTTFVTSSTMETLPVRILSDQEVNLRMGAKFRIKK
ncbi:MAG: hypothetical protein HKN16_08860 [Saprospiraceae bacterium]|nr:hypothetical protein [Saprospiraceae bacterium]